MSRMKFYPYNFVTREETDIVVSSEDAQFPKENIKHPFTTKVFRTPSGTDTVNIDFDIKTTDDIDTVMVVRSSTGEFGYHGTVTIKANGTNNFTSPAFTTTLTPNETFGFGHVEFSTQSYRFWRLEFESTDYVEVSKIFIGKSVKLDNNNIDFGWSYQNKDRSKFVTNRYGQKFVDIINNEKIIQAQFNLLNIEEVETILSVWDEVGSRNQLWAVVDDTETIISDKERFAGYFTMDQRPVVTNGSFGLYDLSFSLREAL